MLRSIQKGPTKRGSNSNQEWRHGENFFNASDAKNRFGQCLEAALVRPVIITKKERPVAAIISLDEYNRLRKLEDDTIAKSATEAENSGFLGVRETEELLQQID